MRSLADQIEFYLKQLLSVSPEGLIELQRSELAQLFTCVPSQINYVLSTRFSPEQGYLVESRRGGGGFLRIIKLPLNQEDELRKLIDQTVGRMVSQQVGEGLVERLREEGFLTGRESILMKAVIQRETLTLELPVRDVIRASLLRVMLLSLLREDFA